MDRKLLLPFFLVVGVKQIASQFTSELESGMAENLFEGDIAELTPETIDSFVAGDNQRYQQETPETGDGGRYRNAVRDRNLLWPGGNVPYVISGFSRLDRRRIQRAMEEYHRKTCIRFQPRSSERNWIIIKSLDGCWSSVGHRYWETGGQELSVESGGCTRTHGIIVHELMHALGFFHEQSRADRDDFVNIILRNVKSGKGGNFKKYGLNRIQHLGAPYDYGSIMHYGAYSFSRNGRVTIHQLHQGPAIGQRRGLSKWDIYKISKLYKCPVTSGEDCLGIDPATKSSCIKLESSCLTESQRKYPKTTTLQGVECQVWTSTSPHEPTKYLNRPDNNNCWNPEGKLGPWCYTTDPKDRWDYCYPFCNPDCIDVDVKTKQQCYKQNDDTCKLDVKYPKSKTVSGIDCQRWTSQEPHVPTNYPNLSDDNYCRNPEGEGPWCYTTDPDKRWEYCYPPCSQEPCLSIDIATGATCIKFTSECLSDRTKRYSKTKTVNGVQCQQWTSDSPHTPTNYNNRQDDSYCWNPEGDQGPWCYTIDPNKRWDYCFPVCNPSKCLGHDPSTNQLCMKKNSDDCKLDIIYPKTKTVSGVECQKWTSQEPHVPTNYANLKDDNYCRNPEGQGPWCYTTDPDNRWDYCYPTCP